jgi:glycerol-3-phosphate dehydrogenase
VGQRGFNPVDDRAHGLVGYRPMDPKAFAPDLVVIGGGMGGISTTVRSRRLGAKVVLVEPASLGGT